MGILSNLWGRHSRWALWAAGALLGVAGTARAQSMPGAREYAEAVVALNQPRWEGQVVDWPEPRERPESAYVLESDLRPLAVQAAPGVPRARAARALEALEAARDLLAATGWPAPRPDGGRGGTGGFDLYLAPLDGAGAAAGSDGPVVWALQDAVSSFGIVDPRVARGALEACVTSAYAQAALLGQDPAEAAGWRRATGAFVAWLVTGRLGCEGRAATQQQRSWRSWIPRGSARDASGGALMLAMLSARHDGGTGVFVRELWQLARQRSGDLAGLRGSPDLWEALEASLEARDGGPEDPGSEVSRAMEDLAVARYFAGKRFGHGSMEVLASLGPAATVPIAVHLPWRELPTHTPAAEPPLEPFGSAYAVVDVTDAPDDGILRVWLRGEYGVKWSLVAVRLDREGRELHRVTAPTRKVPKSYLPVQLDAQTARVLIVVTNLSSRLPDADIPDENTRSFKLIVDQGSQQTALGPGP